MRRLAQAGFSDAEMGHMSNRLLSLFARWACDRGQTMAEYGVLIAVIALVVVVAAVTLGGSLSTLFHNTAGKV
jgi:pilus assembly protein Flp/PilA